jgi:hypothetical protein
MHDARARVVITGARPLQAACFETLVVDAGETRRQSGDLIHDGSGVSKFKAFGAHFLGQLTDNPAIIFAFADRFDGLTDALNTTFRVGKSAVFFRETGGR